MVKTGVRFEEVLARLYCDAAFRERFLQDPQAVASTEAGLSEAEVLALVEIDRDGLKLASSSFAFKREGR